MRTTEEFFKLQSQARKCLRENVALKIYNKVLAGDIIERQVLGAMIKFADELSEFQQEKAIELREKLQDFLNWMDDNNFVNALAYMDNKVTVDEYLTSKDK